MGVEKKPVFKEQVTRPSVIMKPMKEMKKEAKVPNLADILTSCGIEYDLVDSPEHSPVQSPSSIHSDMELEKTQELIDELEEFFMKTDGTPTVVDEEVIDTNITMEELNNAVTTNMMTEDGQNVVIVIAPSSPSESLVSISQDPIPSPRNSPRNTPSPGYTQDSDPEWSPSPASVSSPPGPMRPRKKYARSKPPQPPRAVVGDGDRVQVSEETDDGSWSGFICCSSQILNLHPTFIDLIVNLFLLPSCHSNYYLCVILAQSVTFILSRKLIIHDDIGF